MDIKLTKIKNLLPIIVCVFIDLGISSFNEWTTITSFIIITMTLFMLSLENKGQSIKLNIISMLKNIFILLIGILFSLLLEYLFGTPFIVDAILTYILYLLIKIFLGYEDKENVTKNLPIFEIFYNIKVKSINLNLILKYSRNIILVMLIQSLIMCVFYPFIFGMYYYYEKVIFILIIMIIPHILILTIITDKIIKLEKIKLGISEVKKGKLDYKIQLEKDIIFNEIVSNINEIGYTVNIAVEDRLKSERMKNELITNVSHDLKTPLTAIINYISLMKKENISPDYINDYVKVLDKRANRLKILIEDLFEVSTIGSNSMELNLEKTDLSQLLTQTLVELEEAINESNLNFIVNNTEKEIYSLIDGKKTFRVFENLISNIIKYSLEGTRVYIDLEEKEDNVVITFKNISKNILNFNKDEITERFVRGDLSRSTEGSGLGLSISKGIVESQNGNFYIDIIGDLFIVVVSFKILNE